MKRFRRLGSVPARLADFIVGRPFLVLAILLALTVAAGLSARNIRFDFNPEAVFGSGNTAVKYAEQFRRDFGDDETVIIIGLEATGKSDVVSPTALDLAGRDRPRVGKSIPHVLRVESLISMETPRVTFSIAAQDVLRADHQRDRR